MRYIAIACTFALALGILGCKKKQAEPTVISEALEYQQDSKDFQGYIAFPDHLEKKVPGVLVIHEWDGLGDYVKERSRQLAGMGYVAFAMDMYGKGIRAKNHEEAAKLSGAYMKDIPLMKSRIYKALEILKSNENVDPNRIVIIGYCFGGGAALQLALDGADVDGVVTFHGMLPSPEMDQAKKIQAKLQIHHGADDTFVTPDKVEAFKSALDKAKVDYTFYSYEGAVHGFSNNLNGTDNSTGIAYNKAADQKSWGRMKEFLKKLFQ